MSTAEFIWLCVAVGIVIALACWDLHVRRTLRQYRRDMQVEAAVEDLRTTLAALTPEDRSWLRSMDWQGPAGALCAVWATRHGRAA